MKTTIVGIDPGLVHTGCVAITFDQSSRTISTVYTVVNGLAVNEVLDWLRTLPPVGIVYIEDYKPRSHFDTDSKMMAGVHKLHLAIPKSILKDNAGVEKIVKPALLELVGAHNFLVRTNHQDLQSAARVLLLGMLGNPDQREILNRLLEDTMLGVFWKVEASYEPIN